LTSQRPEYCLSKLPHGNKYGTTRSGGYIHADGRKAGNDYEPGPYTSGSFPERSLIFSPFLSPKEAFTNNPVSWKRFRKRRSFAKTAKLKTNAAQHQS
jgi:hypothetical protein